MSRAMITETHLTAIANAIRGKNGSSDTYTPPQMAAAIQAIPTGITPTGTKNITQNGTHDVTQYASANVNVQPNLQSKTATENGTVTPDPGYDGLSSVLVDVSGGGGGSILYGTDAPASSAGNNGDTYVQYHVGLETTVRVTGGYNGGAVVAVEIDGVQVFTATAADTYNQNYNITQADVSTDIGTVSIQIIPPASTTGQLYITVTGPENSKTSNPPMQGSNTSYGYGNYSNTFFLIGSGSSGDRIADAIFIKQSGTWKGVGDVV